MTTYKPNWITFSAGAITIALGAFVITSCGSSNGSQSGSPGQRQAQSLYDKYGGQATVRKIVDEAVTGVIADCTQNPFFTQDVINFDNVQVDGNGHGANGHDTADRFKSCLDAQFTAALGGPSPYTGATTVSGIPSRSIPGQTYDCEDMATAHSRNIGVNPAVFDQFITDVGVVLKRNGVSDADINTIAKSLMGLKPQIVAPPAEQRFYNFQPGDPTNQPALACSIPAPPNFGASTANANATPSPSGMAGMY